jgi:hypothetical protein
LREKLRAVGIAIGRTHKECLESELAGLEQQSSKIAPGRRLGMKNAKAA